MEPYSTWSAPAYLHGGDPPRKKPQPVIYEIPAWAEPGLHVPPAWGDLGTITGPEDMRLSRAAMYQIAKAYAGSRLAAAEQAEDMSLFATTAINNATAYLKAAYWIAVAARVVGSRLLAARAQVVVSKGNALLVTPLSGQFTGSVGTIFRDAATTVRGHAGRDPAALAVASRLEALAAESTTLASRAEAAKGTLSPLDDLSVAREKYGRYAVIGGGIVAGVAALWFLSRALGSRK